MAPIWTNVPVDALQEGIARLRQLSLQIDHAHELVTANTEILERDREHVRFGALRQSRNLKLHEPEQDRAAVAHPPPRARRARRRR